MELDCTMFNKVTLFTVDDREGVVFPITVFREDGNPIVLTKYGQYTDADFAKCVIFPKGKTTWEGFVPPCQFKDGDIVALDTEKGAQLFIFKEYIYNHDCVKCYMMLDCGGEIDFEIGDYYVERFATEEEKEKLFKAIEDNGYKWNPETKTLEKITEPSFEVGNRVRLKSNHNFVFTITGIEEDSYVCGAKAAFWFDDQDDYELVPNKFDITTLKPFDKVLVRDSDKDMWCASIFSHTWKDKYFCIDTWHNQCIPYEANKKLLGTTNNPAEYGSE